MKIRQLKKDHRHPAQFVFWGNERHNTTGYSRLAGTGWSFDKNDNKETFKLEILF